MHRGVQVEIAGEDTERIRFRSIAENREAQSGIPLVQQREGTDGEIDPLLRREAGEDDQSAAPAAPPVEAGNIHRHRLDVPVRDRASRRLGYRIRQAAGYRRDDAARRKTGAATQRASAERRRMSPSVPWTVSTIGTPPGTREAARDPPVGMHQVRAPGDLPAGGLRERTPEPDQGAPAGRMPMASCIVPR